MPPVKKRAPRRKKPTPPRQKKEVKIYFDNGKFTVTQKNLKTPRKTYRINRIEKISVRRDPLFLALALAIPMLGFFYAFNPLLYNYERIILGGIPVFLIIMTSRIGILFIESKAISDMAAIGEIATIRKVRESVEDVLETLDDDEQDLDY